MSNRAVKLGLYGCGNRTRALLDSLAGEGQYEVTAAYDVRPEAAAEACEQYGGRNCASAEELIGCDAVEAFLISLDPLAHPDAFDATVEAGRPIFMEKPIAMSAKRARQMMDKARERGVPVHVGFMRRYLQKHVHARRFLAENDPGRVFSVSCRWFHAGETEMINCLNNSPDNFRLKVSQIPFHCCHALDVILLYGGDVKAVEARGLKVIERRYPSPDEVIALLEFENGVIGSFHYSSMAYKGALSYLIHAENYTLTFENGLEIWRRPRYKPQRDDGARDCRPTYHKNIGPDRYAYGTDDPTPEILLDFLNAVRDQTPMKVTIEDAVKVAELAEAIELSFKRAARIELPLRFDE